MQENEENKKLLRLQIEKLEEEIKNLKGPTLFRMPAWWPTEQTWWPELLTFRWLLKPWFTNPVAIILVAGGTYLLSKDYWQGEIKLQNLETKIESKEIKEQNKLVKTQADSLDTIAKNLRVLIGVRNDSLGKLQGVLSELENSIDTLNSKLSVLERREIELRDQNKRLEDQNKSLKYQTERDKYERLIISLREPLVNILKDMDQETVRRYSPRFYFEDGGENAQEDLERIYSNREYLRKDHAKRVERIYHLFHEIIRELKKPEIYDRSKGIREIEKEFDNIYLDLTPIYG